MIIAYGGYLHAVDETAVSMQRDNRVNRFGIVTSVVERWALSGMLFGDTPIAVSGSVAAFETAYNVNGNDFALLDNNASTVHRALRSLGSLGGVRVTNYAYPIGTGAEYTTYRTPIRYSTDAAHTVHA